MNKIVILLIGVFLPIVFIIYWTKKFFTGNDLLSIIYKTNTTSVVDSKIKAMTSFDKQYEVFKWEGNFEQYKAIFNSWLSYDSLRLTKDDYLLEIKYNKKRHI